MNRGVQGGNTPHKFVLSTIYELPFGPGKPFLNSSGVVTAIMQGWQLNTFLNTVSGTPFSISANAASLNAPGSGQPADQIKNEVEVFGDTGPGVPYFDVTAFRPVTDARFGTAGFNTLRGPGVANIDASLFRTFAFSRAFNMQVRFEVFNVTNTPHFGNPSGTNVSNLQLNADGTVRSLNGFGVVDSISAIGREYDQRYFRIGLRVSF